MGNAEPGDRVHGHHHAAQFHGNDAELLKTVATFLSEGLVSGQPAVVIATRLRLKEIQGALESRSIDVEHARRFGDLVLLDADETLATFMVDGVPLASTFKKVVGDVIAQTLRGRERTPIRAYDEMVDVLWKQGATEAAVRLEVLWNELASTHAFSLLCGYAIGKFYKQTQQYDQVSDLHTHVQETEHTIVPFEPKSAKSAKSA